MKYEYLFQALESQPLAILGLKIMAFTKSVTSFLGHPVADLEKIFSFLAAWLTCQKISLKKCALYCENARISEENAWKLIFPTEIERD